MGEDLEQLKQRIPLLTYLQRHNWSGSPAAVRSEFVGLCPLHEDTRPSFYVNPRKNLFYCHGCGQGGDLIRFVQLSQHLSFRQSLAYLQEQLAPSAQLLEHTATFYQLELHRYPEGIQYLAQRGVQDAAVIEELGIGYARGGNLRPHLQQLGYSLERLLELGLIRPQGQDAFCRRVIFPCRQQDRIVNLYGRSIGDAFPHRLLPRSKGNLFAWESVRQFRTLILVEGLFDLAVLWQAGFRNTTCAIGTHLTPTQLAQLGENPDRCVYIAFDQDENQAGQRAADALLQVLDQAGLKIRLVDLPAGHDPNSYFLAGASAENWPHSAYRFEPPRDDSRLVSNSENWEPGSTGGPRCKTNQAKLLMQGLLGKPCVPPSPLFVFDTQPLAKPSARMLLHGSVGLADRSQAEVVSPTRDLPVERTYQRCRILLGLTPAGHLADRLTQTLHSFLGGSGAPIGPPRPRIAKFMSSNTCKVYRPP